MSTAMRRCAVMMHSKTPDPIGIEKHRQAARLINLPSVTGQEELCLSSSSMRLLFVFR